jgi:hypothetical protein
MTKEEALRLALEALTDALNKPMWNRVQMESAITAIKAALEAKDEPFEYWNAVEGWVKIDEVRDHFDSVGCGTIYKTSGEDRVPLYTTPPQRTWVGLTDEEFWELDKEDLSLRQFVQAIEAKLKEKNT